MLVMSRDEAIASCPGWNVVDLAQHLGLVHRWADELVRRRAPERLPRVATLEDREVVTPSWVEMGGKQLVATLRGADPDDEMWAWGNDQHCWFSSRRHLHETRVHRMDLKLAAEQLPRAESAVVV